MDPGFLSADSKHSKPPACWVTNADSPAFNTVSFNTNAGHGHYQPAMTSPPPSVPYQIRSPGSQFRSIAAALPSTSDIPAADGFDCESPTGLPHSPQSPPSRIPSRPSVDMPPQPATDPRRDRDRDRDRDPFSHTGLSYSRSSNASLNRKISSSSLHPVTRTPSLKGGGVFAAGSFGPSSAASSCFPSPIISAMGDVTPLPSPMLPGTSPGPWRRLSATRQTSSDLLPGLAEGLAQDLTPEAVDSLASALARASKRNVELPPGNSAAQEKAEAKMHGRNRSVSEYVPDPLGIPKRHITVSGSQKVRKVDGAQCPFESQIKREAHMAEARGIVASAPLAAPPTPPPSVSSRDSSDQPMNSRPKSRRTEHFEARCRSDGKRRRWRSVRFLGVGTFSRVMLATSQQTTADGYEAASSSSARRSLVAIKVCEHGPRGGASEERVEMSLKRELEIMQLVHHPSLVDLKAWSIEPTRAILVLGYCHGGDLFDVATAHRHVLTATLTRRMFAELVGAVRYLHDLKIVHRDIKLENVLVNLPVSELADPSADWAQHPYPIITLTDLGLSRRIADGEKLETRCGSDDYAAPEVIMGQPYDGRAIDAWSLGVLLYALLEARLPFDPNPNVADSHRMRSRTSHRIARVEWRWVDYGGDDGDHDANEAKFKERGLLSAMEITEGLLKRARSRWPLEKVAQKEWIKGAVAVEDGLKFREQDEGQVVQ